MNFPDEFLEIYRLTQALPHRKYIEQYSLFRMCQGLANKKILDLACREGSYCRLAIERQAAYVLGIDENKKAIEEAQKQAQGIPNLEYKHAHLNPLPVFDKFDLVFGVHVLHHADSKAHLMSLAEQIYQNLKPGGRFIGINDNPGNAPETFKKYKKYGFYKSGPKQRSNGDTLAYHYLNEKGQEYTLEHTYLSLETYEEAFLEAGFSDFHWKTLMISEQSKKQYNLDFWRTFLNYPPIIGITATR